MENAKNSTESIIKEFLEVMENIYDSDKYSSSMNKFEVAFLFINYHMNSFLSLFLKSLHCTNHNCLKKF